jgi:hypothetical protein
MTFLSTNPNYFIVCSGSIIVNALEEIRWIIEDDRISKQDSVLFTIHNGFTCGLKVAQRAPGSITIDMINELIPAEIGDKFDYVVIRKVSEENNIIME